MPAILLFPAGLILGSFITAVAHRVPRGISVVSGRSQCPLCGIQIPAYDNVPLLSWLLLRGRSRCCRQPISLRYPLTELCLGALFVLIAGVLAGDPTRLLLGLAFASTLLAVSVTDLERRIIPNRILLVSALICVGVAAGADPASLPERAAAALGAGGLLFAAALAYPEGMGMGDVKLAALMGLYLGSSAAPALLAAFMLGSAAGLVLVARHGPGARKQALPFAPFLALGGLVGLLAGPEVIDWYLGTFS